MLPTIDIPEPMQQQHPVVEEPPPRRGLFDDRVLLLQRPLHGFGRVCRRILILLGCFALEHVHLRFPPAFTAERPKLPSRDRARADAEPFTPPPGGPSG